MPAYHLDVLGEVCPIPLYKTKQKMDILEKGDILIIEIDLIRSVRNILDWSNKYGYDLVVYQVGKGIWQIKITKN